MKGETIAPGIIFHQQTSSFEKVVFLLNNTSYIHLGDQFFWAPIILAVKESQYKIEVLLPGDMNKFWQLNGIESRQAISEDSKNTLYITDAPVVLSHEFKNRSYIAVDLGKSEIDERVSVYLCHKICNILNIKRNTVPLFQLPQKIDKNLEEKIMLLGDNVWLMSDSVTSCPWRFTNLKRKKIWSKTKDIFNAGGKIIYIKGETEVQLPYLKPDIISLDLRGETSPDDILGIMKLPNVQGSISFDNFLMHTALLANKKAYVMFRGRFSKNQREHCYQNVNPAFEKVNENNISYL